MSTTATSGLWALTLRSRSSASPAWPTTSKPALLEQAHDALAQQHRVVGDDYPHGILAVIGRAAAGLGVDLQPAVDDREPIGQAAQTGAPLGVGAADAVVGHLAPPARPLHALDVDRRVASPTRTWRRS